MTLRPVFVLVLVAAGFSCHSQATGDYRSFQTGPWGTTSTWERFNGAIWVNPAPAPSSSDGVITVRSPHNVSVAATVTIDQTIVDPGGTLTLNSGVTLNIANGAGSDLFISGTMSDAGTLSVGTALVTIDNGGTYTWNQNGGTIPSINFAPGSTCKVIGVTTTIVQLPASCHHLIWDCPSQTAVANVSSLATVTVGGTLTVNSTGPSGQMRLANGGARTLNIIGDLIMNGGVFIFTVGVGNPTVAVTGNVTLNGGTLNASSSTGVATFTVGGNWSLSGGTFSPGSSTNAVTFIGAGTQTIGGSSSTTFNGLTINTSSSTDIVQLSRDQTVTNVLTLTDGGLDLNSHTLSITNSAAAAITRTAPGYIKSETALATNPSKVSWTSANVAGRTYVFPFGVSSAASDYVPLTFVNQQTAASPIITASTRATAASDNQPWATGTNMTSASGGSALTVIDRWWDISSTVNPLAAPGADITFSYRGVENTLSPAGLQTGTIVIQHWDPLPSIPGWEVPFAGGSVGVTGATVGAVTVTGARKFSPYIAGASTTPLPIKLVSFTGRCDGLSTILQWTTETETGNDYFTLETSTDGHEWKTIGKVKGAGTSTSTHTYSFKEERAEFAKAYFRLKQTDFDGRSDFSKILTVANCGSRDDLVVYPNPSTGVFNLKFTEDHTITSLDIYGFHGLRVWHSDELPSTVDLTDRPAGVYFLRLRTESGEITKKLLIQRD